MLRLAHMSGKEQDYIKETFDRNGVVSRRPNANGFEKTSKFVNNRNGAEPLNKQVLLCRQGRRCIWG